MWKAYVQQKIEEESKRIEYRQKLRHEKSRQDQCNHRPSLKSFCAVCRKMFWMKHAIKCEFKPETVGVYNIPKSESSRND